MYFGKWFIDLKNDCFASFSQLAWEDVKRDWLKLPNIITGIRLIATPLPAYFLVVKGQWLAAMLIYMAIVATDKLDGWVARKYDMETEFGKLLDPVVDKFLEVYTLIAQAIIQPILWYFVAITFVREVAVGRLLARPQNRERGVDVLVSGKIKTVAYAIATTALFIPVHGIQQIFPVGVAVGLALFYAITSWQEYAKVYAVTE